MERKKWIALLCILAAVLYVAVIVLAVIFGDFVRFPYIPGYKPDTTQASDATDATDPTDSTDASQATDATEAAGNPDSSGGQSTGDLPDDSHEDELPPMDVPVIDDDDGDGDGEGDGNGESNTPTEGADTPDEGTDTPSQGNSSTGDYELPAIPFS